MNSRREALVITLLFVPMLPAFAQHERYGEMDSSLVNPSIQYSARTLALAQHQTHGDWSSSIHTGPTNNPAHMSAMMATNSQRHAFAECVETTGQVRAAIVQMGNIGRPWSRSRVIYAQQDLRALAENEERFQSMLNGLVNAHEVFWRTLNDVQRSNLEPRLRRLGHLQNEMKASASRLSQTVLDAVPGPAPPQIKRTMDALRKDADRWRSEHRKLATEMSLPH